ncbi:hypothetical protein [Kitasatospora mediocidica]|uniref:hypothetical protein n=1 Tax=Kitasatospora mediocidica TaxID=58352 RepID=UPI000562D759|nr:hypothetical protein [Kitasatospora mediocidica]
MNWLVLYARSRQMPASAAVIALAALVVWALTRGGHGSPDPAIVLLVLTTNVAVAAVGLGGQDTALDATAAIRWAPRRAAHVLLIGAVACVAVQAVQAVGSQPTAAALVVRDSAGLAGLAALGATLCGASYAWTPPTAWLAFTLLSSPPGGIAGQVAGWMILPPGTPAATWTALVLLATGTVSYAVVGPRR